MENFLKNLTKTIWSSRADVINALHNGYNHIFEALLTITRNTDQIGERRNEAQSITKKMEILITIF